MTYARIKDPAALEAALKLARGSYQRHLLLGVEALSGATLRGRAKTYSGRYATSAKNLIRRLQAAQIPVAEERGRNNKRILVIG